MATPLHHLLILRTTVDARYEEQGGQFRENDSKKGNGISTRADSIRMVAPCDAENRDMDDGENKNYGYRRSARLLRVAAVIEVLPRTVAGEVVSLRIERRFISLLAAIRVIHVRVRRGRRVKISGVLAGRK